MQMFEVLACLIQMDDFTFPAPRGKWILCSYNIFAGVFLFSTLNSCSWTVLSVLVGFIIMQLQPPVCARGFASGWMALMIGFSCLKT